MKTIEIKLYKFSELSEEAKQNAIENYRNEGIDNQFMYDEAHETVKAFENIFPSNSRGQNSWLDATVNLDDNILELKGERLRKYILNNFGSTLYKPKYIGSISTNEYVQHKRIKSQKEANKNGKRFNGYYSAINIDNCCVLTGVCYDDDMLDAIYKFLERKDFEGYNLEELILEGYDCLKKSLENEEEFRGSDECIEEDLEANDYDFTEEGNIY